MTAAASNAPVVRVALLGAGTVGSALIDLLRSRAAQLEVQSGARIELGGIAVADLSRARAAHVPAELLTTDGTGLVTDPAIDLVVELIGGVEPAGSLVTAALEAGKPVVTANKALLASARGVALRTLARDRGVDLLYEASVAGAVPLVRVLRESLTGERIRRVMGIVNGTTNFILTRMSEQGVDYGEALAEAQALGLAERDPSADVDGFDAAAKAAILAGVAFGYDMVIDDVEREGITGIEPADIQFAARSGYVVKPLAIVEVGDDGQLAARVHPAMLPTAHLLAGVREACNAVFIEGEAAGEVMLYGQGAGGAPTASAVLGDLIDATRNVRAGTTAPVPDRLPVRLYPSSELRSPCYVRIDVDDEPGVLGQVTRTFGDHTVSIRSMEQDAQAGGARLLFVTHAARWTEVQRTVEALAALEPVRRIGGAIRIVDGPESFGTAVPVGGSAR